MSQTKFQVITIHADGGTPCNIPAKGYGIGYGSYSIDGGTPVRISHGRPMSNNAAEIWTFCSAIDALLESHRDGAKVIKLKFVGDSQIALKWIRLSNKPWRSQHVSKKGSDEFQMGIQRLRELTPKFSSVSTEWKPRIHSVKAFGH